MKAGSKYIITIHKAPGRPSPGEKVFGCYNNGYCTAMYFNPRFSYSKWAQFPDGRCPLDESPDYWFVLPQKFSREVFELIEVERRKYYPKWLYNFGLWIVTKI